MSTTTTTGSAFRNLDVGSDADRPPVSTLAILALGIGLLSLIAPISFYLLPLSIIAIAIGSLALWRIGRDSAVGGAWLAQCGLGLGVISSGEAPHA